MNPCLLNSAFILLFSPCVAFAAGGSLSAAPSPATTIEIQMSGTPSPAQIAVELEKKFPLKDWKSVGFKDDDGQPLMVMKVPNFLFWNSDCTKHAVRDGVEYCGPDWENSPRLSGSVKIAGKIRTLVIGMEGGRPGPPHDRPAGDLGTAFGVWEGYGALLSSKIITLGGYKAYLGEIEDVKKTLPKPTKVMTLIFSNHSYFGVTLDFIETETSSSGTDFVLHKDRVFQGFIDRAIENFQIKVKVEDVPRKVKESASEEKSSSVRCLPPKAPNLRERVTRSDLIFIGVPKEVHDVKVPNSEFWNKQAEFDVKRVLKGNLSESAKTVMVNFLEYGTTLDGRKIDSCSPDLDGAHFDLNSRDELLVYASKGFEFHTSDRNGGGSLRTKDKEVQREIERVKQLLSK